MPDKVILTEQQWRERLSPEQYRVAREAGTERPFTSDLLQEKRLGTFCCAACKTPLFKSDAKFESGCGWPSFFEPLDGANITEHNDTSHGMIRTEVRCATCNAHLGHVFPDGPPPSGIRYCINGVILDFNPDSPASEGA
ncbi:MAG: peptide-methionine (R)-S-oxide reductase MsrB [Planctomycetota bacterium]